MTTLLSIEAAGQPLLDELTRAVDVTPIHRKGVALWRALILEEWLDAAWLNPAGRKIPWAKTKPFGNRPANPTMFRTGGLLRAVLGQGAGGFETIDAEGGSFGVSGSVHPQAAPLRGGSGQVKTAEARRPLTIKVTDRMRGFLAARFGVHLRKSTKAISIERRPFGSITPQLRTGVTTAAVRYIRTGSAEEAA